ncbi:hypothetical protein BDZ97DRAFT_1856324 [Flammula alnicola]|nr:hypothetical protein BDZ97DRAFT_1856324 [Flammula alnicola]
MKYKYPAVLREIQDQVEERLAVKFNHVMLNLYEDGKVYIGNHRDNIENKVIASVSLGASRTFIMTRDRRSKGAQSPDRTSKSMPESSKLEPEANSPKGQRQPIPAFVDRKSWTLDSGSLVVMQGETQRYWKHEIPKEPRVKEGRISLTFRQLESSSSDH